MAEVPPGVVRVMSALPADPAGVVTAHEVPEAQATVVAVAVPTLAVVEPVMNPVPVMVTTVPAASGPAVGVMPVTAGPAS